MGNRSAKNAPKIERNVEGKADMGWISSFEAPLASYLDQLGTICTDGLGAINLLSLVYVLMSVHNYLGCRPQGIRRESAQVLIPYPVSSIRGSDWNLFSFFNIR